MSIGILWVKIQERTRKFFRERFCMIRTRIAPSPTGYPHIGTIYQALFDWAWARKNYGKFIVRIEDTDRSRFIEDAEEKIFSSLDWFGLSEDESPRKNGEFGPYRQSERLKIYQKYARELIANNYAYYCFCAKGRLEEMRQKQQAEKKAAIMYDRHCRNLPADEVAQKLLGKTERVVRLKVPDNEKIEFEDGIRGKIEFDSNCVDDQVLLKSDGFPTYHLAVVIDDHLMGITHVVRGEEWITSTPKHILLYRYFGWEIPKMYHTPVLRNADKSKLSKRQGHTNVDWYRQEGFLPEAILNYLALLGWSHPDEKEIFSIEEFVKLFDLKDLKPVGPIFDLQKLIWMNGEYIRDLDAKTLKLKILEFEPSFQYPTDGVLDKLIPIVQTRIKLLKEFKEMVEPFLYSKPRKLSADEKALKNDLRKDMENINDWKKETISAILFENYIKNKRCNFKVLYLLLLGVDRGLPLADTFEAIGKETTLRLLT